MRRGTDRLTRSPYGAPKSYPYAQAPYWTPVPTAYRVRILSNGWPPQGAI